MTDTADCCCVQYIPSNDLLPDRVMLPRGLKQLLLDFRPVVHRPSARRVRSHRVDRANHDLESGGDGLRVTVSARIVVEGRRTHPVIAHVRLESLISQTLDGSLPLRPPQNPVAPARRPLLRRGVVLRGEVIVLVSRREVDRRLVESAQAEGGVVVLEHRELVVRKKTGVGIWLRECSEDLLAR